jgi:hypothetical protein
MKARRYNGHRSWATPRRHRCNLGLISEKRKRRKRIKAANRSAAWRRNLNGVCGARRVGGGISGVGGRRHQCACLPYNVLSQRASVASAVGWRMAAQWRVAYRRSCGWLAAYQAALYGAAITGCLWPHLSANRGAGASLAYGGAAVVRRKSVAVYMKGAGGIVWPCAAAHPHARTPGGYLSHQWRGGMGNRRINIGGKNGAGGNGWRRRRGVSWRPGDPDKSAAHQYRSGSLSSGIAA